MNRRASAGCLAALLLGGGPAGVAQAPRPPETLVRAADELVGELVDRKHPGITSFLLEVGGVRVADFVSPELERGAPDS